MDHRILEFIGDLRRAEIRISPSEAVDALAASAEIGFTDCDTFKAALASTLIKESRDLPSFERLFNLYFLDLAALGAGLKKALGPEDPRIQELLDRLLADEGVELDEMIDLLLRGQGSEMEMAIRGGSRHAGLERLMYFLQVGFFSRCIHDRFDWAAIEADLDRLMRLLEARGLDPGQLARIRNYLDLRLEAFRRMIRQHVERELERRAYRQGERPVTGAGLRAARGLSGWPTLASSPTMPAFPGAGPGFAGEAASRLQVARRGSSVCPSYALLPWRREAVPPRLRRPGPPRSSGSPPCRPGRPG